MQEHTPGPWSVSENTEGTRDVVAEVWGAEAGWHEIALDVDTLENARLIAAAPQGLALAERMYLWMLQNVEGSLRIRSQEELCALRDFIAEATGQTPREVQEHFEEMVSA